MKAPLPLDEEQRLAALRRYSVLDTPPEQAFDDLTLLAAQICQVPTAMVSLVDEQRQWFKSRVGMDAAETARDISFCAHTILHADAVLEVRDATLDPRFLDSPLVTGDPHMRFYAGAPLIAPDGHALGALCVMDRRPRTLTAEQLAALRALSRRVVAQLELRRQARELAKEIADRQRAEAQLREQFEQLAANEQGLGRLLTVAEKSRRAVLGVLEDEREAQAALRASGALIKDVINSLTAHVVVLDEEGKIIETNEAWKIFAAQNCFLNAAQMDAGANYLTVCDASFARERDADAKTAADGIRAVMDGSAKNFAFEYPCHSPTEQRWFVMRVMRLTGRRKGVVVAHENITERKLAEQALRASEEHFRFLNDLTEATRMLVDPSQIMVVLTRMLGQRLGASRCAYADVEKDGEHFTILHDYTDGCASTVGKYQLSLFGPKAVASLHSGQTLVIRDVGLELSAGEGAEMFNAIGIKAIISCPLVKKGDLRAIMAVHQTTPRDWLPEEVAIVQEVVERCWATIERRTAEDALKASEKRFKALFEQAAVGVAQIDATTERFVQVNQRFCDLAGRDWPELEQLTFAIVTHPQDRDPGLDMARRLKAGALREFTREMRYLKKDGSEVWAIVTVSAMWAVGEIPDYFIAVVQDITERKQMEGQFQQAQKMEAIGTLAGGIAHDFNNVLAAIVGYTDLAKMGSRNNPEVLEYLQAVEEGSRRATELVRQILAFSRRQEQQRTATQLWPIVEEALRLLRATIPATIRFETSVARNGPRILADSTQVHQIIMNLATNAAYAMKDLVGRLGVSLENVTVDADLATIHPGLREGTYLRLGVSDTGRGMDPLTLNRIFEPFFTTKGPGEGTGLGLAVVHGIMQSHDGIVTVYSEPGHGTQFHLYFPAYTGEIPEVEVAREETPRGRGERILFVDDELPLAQMGKKILERLGYTVDAQTLPAEALAAVRMEPKKYDLVITDLTMPGRTGTDLAHGLLEIRPDMAVVLTTGYSATLTFDRVRAMGIRDILMKPLAMHPLGEAVHRVLTASKTT